MRQAFLFNLPSLAQRWSNLHLAYTASSHRTRGALGVELNLSFCSPCPGPCCREPLPRHQGLPRGCSLTCQPSPTAKGRGLPLPGFLFTRGKQPRRLRSPFNVGEEPDSFYKSCLIKRAVFVPAFDIWSAFC